MSSLGTRHVTNGVVYPTIRVASHPGKLLMGVYDGTGAYVEDTVLDRRSGEQGFPVPPGLFPDIADGEASEAIYAGPLYYHFGHFLLESLARAWYARGRPDLPLVWAGAHSWEDPKLRPWQHEILELLGLENPTRVLNGPTRYERLHVPDIGYRYDDRFHPEHAAFMAGYDGPPQDPGQRLWLSRSKLASDARDLFAGPTEQRLAAAGWTIVHPESLGVRDQLDHLARASVVAGEEGSAFHTLMLLKDVTGKRFHILRRHGEEHRNMHTVGDARGVDQTFHTLEHERVLRAEGRVVSKLNPSSSEILDLLQVSVPPARATRPSRADEAALQALERLGPNSLLDTGSASPTVVLGSSAAVRVTVNPHFDDDPRAHVASGVAFFELDLATYVEHFHDRPQRFDVVRLSGSSFEDLMRAFRATKRLGHPETTWMLGIGEVAARAALAIQSGHPHHVARRVLVGRTPLYIARRRPGKLWREASVAELSGSEVARQTRWLPLGRLRRLHRQDPS
ncbi:glycosyltransferase 61 family protein [Nocardioides lianchengensis]|uniref:Glycosyltransferase 61 catalytic domain-containing protein n=1 Tax=Nocardioides lianchengensis TaxID=1045774 RepID=A0A1G6NG00_9ACTN|nr:glycosyltransferase 61 family protein [Nocardioides lianchengensis]NYG10746.1 phage protein U [Nocardioides lianchengensis]SDC66256.1 Protein of unknown function [Nocardioides lianchengensis]